MDESDNSSDRTIPSFVGQYRRRLDEKIPEIVVINLDSEVTKAEKRICDFFKCTKNWGKNDEIQEIDANGRVINHCFATRHTPLNFDIHLKEKHSSDELFCIYCSELLGPDKSVLKMYSHRYLIKHMLKRHRFRRFQCNLCLYRAVTEEHLIIHQKSEHRTEYKKTIADISSSDGNFCKVFVCPKVAEDNRNLYYFWRRFKTQRLNSEGKNETSFQCLYCDFLSEHLTKVVDHSVRKHPDFPLLYYIPEPQVSSSTAIQSVNDINTYSESAVIRPMRPKVEPQDNCISSTQRSPESMTQTSPESVSGKSPETTARKSPDSVTQKLPEPIPRMSPYFVTQKLPEPMPRKLPDSVTQKLPESSTHKSVETMARKSTEYAFQKSLQSMAQKLPQSLPQDIDEAVAQMSSEPIVEKSPETVTLSDSELTENPRKRVAEPIEAPIPARRVRISSSDAQSSEGYKRKTVPKPTIEESNVAKENICLFCDKTFVDIMAAKNHLESHFNHLEKDGEEMRRTVLQWIQTFLLKQWQLSSFIDSEEEIDPEKGFYYCPLCVRLAKIHNRVAKNYKSFSEVRNHLWHHSCWLSVKCKLCLSLIPNSDPNIAKHFVDNHLSVIKTKYKFLTSEDPKLELTPDQRSQLKKKLILVTYNPTIEEYINEKMFIKIKENFELEWRKVFKCDKIEPELTLKRLSQKDFDKVGKSYKKEMEYYIKSKDKERERMEAPIEESDEEIQIIFNKLDNVCEKVFLKGKEREDKKKEKKRHKKYNIEDDDDDDEASCQSSSYHSAQDTTDRVLQLSDYVTNDILNRNQNRSQPSTSQQYSALSPPRNRLLSTESSGSESNRVVDSDSSVEEFYRISCYHCTDKFKTRAEFQEHSNRKHPKLVARMYAKKRRK